MAKGVTVGIREEIDRLWDEVLKMREETGICQGSLQKKEALRLMRQLLKEGNEEDKCWVREQFVKIRCRLARLDQAEGKIDAAQNQLKKGEGILDRHPEIDQGLLKRPP